jgi:hypothetical protein
VTSIGTPPDFPVQSFPDRLRTVIATALAGVLVAVVLSVLLDSLILRRRPVQHAGPSSRAESTQRRLPPVGPREAPGTGMRGQDG